VRRAPRTRNRFFTAALFTAAIFAAGCADQPPPPPAPVGGAQPKVLSNLNDVAATPVNPLAIDAVPKRGEGLLVDTAPADSGGQQRVDLTDPGVSRDIGTDRNPGTVRLLNDKAAQFDNFCAVLLDRIYIQLTIAEKTEEISRTKVPTELKAAVVTAIMDKKGKLIEIILEQHSGKAKIDNLLIDACKKGIWYENPPEGALSGDGDYKLTIKLKLQNFASSDSTHWSFITDLAIGLG
jgi:hypothetical protein